MEGAFLIEPQAYVDERGSFTRLWDRELFLELGMEVEIAQIATAVNLRRGTLRGLHFQDPPADEAKVITCTSGALYDVMVDLRPGSPTCRQWSATTLTAAEGRLLYVPRGFAHGYQALEDHSIALYTMSAPFRADLARGIRYDDPTLAIPWPVARPILSARDKELPPLDV